MRLGSYSLDPIKVHFVQLRHFSMAQYQFNLKKKTRLMDGFHFKPSILMQQIHSSLSKQGPYVTHNAI